MKRPRPGRHLYLVWISETVLGSGVLLLTAEVKDII